MSAEHDCVAAGAVPRAAIELKDILPNIDYGLDGAGFLFGSGTSSQAGYPMMRQLTADVLSALATDDRGLLADLTGFAAQETDQIIAEPNIEELIDLITERRIQTADPRFATLESRIRALIVSQILDVAEPDLDLHRRFIDSLRRRAAGAACSVWVFTTNYDVLFEAAAAKEGVLVENGFRGTTDRYFAPEAFGYVVGTAAGREFSRAAELRVNLLKLHGSLSWFVDSGRVVERHPAAVSKNAARAMILPRRRKALESMNMPYKSLFSVASDAIGRHCKYLVSCGFSYSDDHITDQLLAPALRANQCRLFGLLKQRTRGAATLEELPGFSVAYDAHAKMNGAEVKAGTDLWDFARFVALFE